MRGKNLTGYILLAIILVASVRCKKYTPYEFPEDPEIHRKDSITLVLNNILSPDSIEKTVVWLQNMVTRFALAGNNREVAAKIRDKFVKMGYTDSRLDSFWISKTWNSQNYSMWQYNVITELRGLVYPDSVMVIGSHYDAIVSSGNPFISTPGANDNAGGVAAMAEIARVMKNKNYSPLTSIQFVAFGAEEIGLLGSRDYAGKIGSSGGAIKMMINNDMIANVISSNVNTWEINIVSYKNSLELLNKAKSLRSRYTSLISTYDSTNYNKSDSYSFFLNNYKAIYFASNNKYSYYHTVNDIAANCNFDFCTAVAKISCALLVYSD
jgi:leucyl aminopeptidase